MRRQTKKALYESIMKDVAKTVKKHLNEAYVEDSESIELKTKYGTFTAVYNYKSGRRETLDLYKNGLKICSIDVIDNDIDFDYSNLSNSEIREIKKVAEIYLKKKEYMFR